MLGVGHEIRIGEAEAQIAAAVCVGAERDLIGIRDPITVGVGDREFTSETVYLPVGGCIVHMTVYQCRRGD